MSIIEELAGYMRDGDNVGLIGPPGCAKSKRTVAAAALADYKTWVKDRWGRTHSTVWRMVRMERCDLQGVPCPDFAAGVCRQLPMEALDALRSTKEKIILFLDDFPQAPPDVQASAMGLFDEDLPPNVIIWVAGNRATDKSAANSIIEPIRSRLNRVFEIAGPNLDEEKVDGGVLLAPWSCALLDCGHCEVCGWIEWALNNNAPAEIIAWHRNTKGRGQYTKDVPVGPGALYRWRPHGDPAVRMPDFRGWESMIKSWNKGKRDLHSLGSIIGKPDAQPLIAYARLIDKCPSMDSIRIDPFSASVPTEAGPLYLTSTMLGIHASPELVTPIVQYMERLPRVYAAYVARDMHKKLEAKLSGNKVWIAWFLKNQELFK